MNSIKLYTTIAILFSTCLTGCAQNTFSQTRTTDEVPQELLSQASTWADNFADRLRLGEIDRSYLSDQAILRLRSAVSQFDSGNHSPMIWSAYIRESKDRNEVLMIFWIGIDRDYHPQIDFYNQSGDRIEKLSIANRDEAKQSMIHAEYIELQRSGNRPNTWLTESSRSILIDDAFQLSAFYLTDINGRSAFWKIIKEHAGE